MTVRSPVPLLLLLSAIGCDAVLGIERLPVGTSVQYVSAACERCVEADCAAASKACLDDRACAPVARCLALCAPDDIACRGECETAMPSAVATPTFAALDRCVRGVCTEACTGVSGLARAFGACECLEKACKPQILACIRSSQSDPAARVGECERRVGCMAASTIDPRTVVRCQADHMGGDTEARELKDCFASNVCPGCPVAGTGLYECVGKYRWLSPVTPKAKMTFKVGRFDTTQTPIADVQVRACGIDACDHCDTATPVAEGRTKADGSVVLDVPTGLTGFAGCFDFRADGYALMSMTLGRPLERDSSSVMLLIPAESLPLLGAVAGSPLNPERGHIVAFAVDCFVNFAPGIALDVFPPDPGTKRGYFLGSTFDTSATETGKLGTAMFLNVPPGFVTLQMKQAGRIVGSQPTVVRKGVLTAVIDLPKVQD